MSAKPHLNNLIIRFVVFCSLFILVSGLLGPWIITTRLLYGFYFYLYANFGKMLIFSIIVFFLMARDKILTFKIDKYSTNNLFFLLASCFLLLLFFPVGNLLLLEENFYSNLPLSLWAHLILVSLSFFLIPGIFGLKFMGDFYHKFRKEIKICLAISMIYSFLIWQVWKLWPYFSGMVMNAEKFLFSLTFRKVSVIPPMTLMVENFSVSIAEACSGLDSLFLFSTLYLIIGILDWKKFNPVKYILMFIPVTIGLILVNILRVYLLILIGVLISPELTLKLFHTYAGMVLFILYFAIFWKIFYKHFLKKLSGSSSNPTI